MCTYWKLDTHGDPLGAARDFMGKLKTRRERILQKLDLCREQYNRWW